MRQRVQDVVAGTIDFGTPAAAEIANWILTGDHEPIKQSKEDPNFVDLCFQWLEQNVEFGSDYTLDEMSKSLARFIHKGYEQDAEQALPDTHDRCETLRELLKVIIERGDFYSPGHSDEKCIRAVQRAKELLG
jgi:hypothetical protein